MNATARYEWRDSPHKPFLQGGVAQSGTRAALLDSYVYPATNYLGETVNQFGYTGAFTTFDFSAGAYFKTLKVEAFITNAFDTRGILSRLLPAPLRNAVADARVYPTKPQQFGLKLSQRF
jgi:hypothetical protein